jgi:hypothetical protein
MAWLFVQMVDRVHSDADVDKTKKTLMDKRENSWLFLAKKLY